jgi:hypothetical protein
VGISDLHWTACLVSSLVVAGATVALAFTYRPAPPPPQPRLVAHVDSPPSRESLAAGNLPLVTVRVEPPVEPQKKLDDTALADEKPAQPSADTQASATPPAANSPAMNESPGGEKKTPDTTDERPLLDLSSRSHRSDTIRQHGGSTDSERAVERGLRWLIAHQSNDGSWRFDFVDSACHGYCRNPGTEPTTTGSTALALLAFLGAGYTNQDNEYQIYVDRALYYLRSKARASGHGVDLTEGTKRGLYGHGLAAIALCEAYALTKDKSLRDLAQRSIYFIVEAQDNHGGGWRYTPRVPGDTSVTGWQVMALKCAEMARLEVPSPTFVMAQHFLDTVQIENGSQYVYMPTQPTRTHALTAIGLLTRMYLGWQVNDQRLARGVNLLSDWGPSQGDPAKVDMYYNYYATQIMHHWGSVNWLQWNSKMRDFLVKSQATSGHEAGSWHFDGGYGNFGGRLYNTAMAIMTLEVYYRYIPIYRPEAVRQ